MRLVECVPNFSEGRDKAKVDAIAQAAGSVDGVRILDVEMDKDHHRSVLTFVGNPEAVCEAAFRATAKARELIDMNTHRGEHPRIGATDVIPFIPVAGVTMDDCVRLARKVGERISKELEIPVYLYGQAASRLDHQDLAAVRRGQFEGLRAAIEADPDRSPDYGPFRLHSTAGATAVGAREQIVNFNVNLDLTDPEAGKAIARKIRTSGEGLPELRAKEIKLSTGNIQISTVLTNYKTTSLKTVFGAISAEAAAKGAKVLSTEIVGLIPRQALVDFAKESVHLEGFQSDVQILEERLVAVLDAPTPPKGEVEIARPASWQESAASVAAALANSDATPGGGAASAILGAMGAGLAQMAVGISLQSKKLDPTYEPLLQKASGDFAKAREQFLKLGDEDAKAFEAFMAIFKTPKDKPGREESLQKALSQAAQAPMAVTRLAVQVRRETVGCLAVCVGSVASDLRCAAEFLGCAARCAAENVRINAKSFSDKDAAEAMEKDLEKILAEIEPAKRKP
jgi:glutamate formiminotransferase